ncbi:hypothetical protein ElyMa_003676900 [Elysia marginata]|uniref:G-protein coupled receptors family 1 profile domain-containing protein n=1 Tax=Elysia marginata TaxID=1093978 RepID=A0AAV4EZN8_9GAST|nr:hypothetical protein ElyMa_003676900 [Elysia marginata]
MLVPVWLYSDPKHHRSCIIFNSPRAYSAGPLVGALSLCIGVVCVSTVGLAKLALKHDRKREMRTNGGVSLDKTKNRMSKTGKNGVSYQVTHSFSNDQEVPCDMKSVVLVRNHITLAVVSSGQVPSQRLYGIESRYLGNRNTTSSVLQENSDGRPTLEPVLACPIRTRSNSEANRLPIEPIHAASHRTDNLLKTNKPKCLKPIESNLQPLSSTTTGIFVEETQRSVHINPNSSSGACSTNNGKPQTLREKGKPNTEQDADFTSKPNQPHKDTKKSSELRKVKRKTPFNKAQFKILKFVVMMFGCYLVCVFPTLVTLVFDQLFHAVSFSHTTQVGVTLCLFSNSGVNCVIMARMNKTFRKALMSSFPCLYLKLCCRR